MSAQMTRLVALLLLFVLSAPNVLNPCTIAVVSGKVTIDGRPLLWKNRDVTDQDNLVRYFEGGKYAFIGVTQAGEYESVYAGINSEGFAILNSASYDLEGDGEIENGKFMRRALEECATVEEFEMLLFFSNEEGRKTKANFGVIDAIGNAAIFETGNTSYTRFDANQSPDGFVVRTNFALTGVDEEKGGGYERYARANELFTAAVASGAISHEFILIQVARDLVNESVNPYPLPFEGSQNDHPKGYLYTNYSINRFRTASCSVFHGVLPGEDQALSTMWCLLGEPVCGLAVPLWVYTGSIPYVMEGAYTSPMRDAVKIKENQCYTDPLSNQYIDTYALVDVSGNGILPFVRTIEDKIFADARKALSSWRLNLPPSSEIKNFQEEQALWGYRRYLKKKSRKVGR